MFLFSSYKNLVTAVTFYLTVFYYTAFEMWKVLLQELILAALLGLLEARKQK
jgi:hypothetical protein